MANKSVNTSWFERATTGFVVLTIILVALNRSVAATNSNGGQLYDEYTAPAKIVTNNKPIKKIAKKHVVKSSRMNNMFPASMNKPRSKKAITATAIDSEILKETDSLQNDTKKNNATLVAANTNGKPGLKYLRKSALNATAPAVAVSSTAPATVVAPIAETGSSTTKIETPKPAEASPFSGGVNFTIGHDSNLDPNKSYVSGTFYEIDPSINAKSGNWSGSFSGSMKDFSNQAISDTNKVNEINANVTYAPDINETYKSTTALDGKYHDEMWPDYINGKDVNGYDHGMPIRFTTGTLTQKIDADYKNGLSAQAGVDYQHQENSNNYSDWAAPIFGARLAPQSFNEYKAFGRIGIAAGENVEFAARPSIADREFTERYARQPDGSTGGVTQSAPLKKLLTEELALDINFKFLGSTVGPTAAIGQVSDQVYAAENQVYYTVGLQGNIVLAEKLKLSLQPMVAYKHANFDNWTNATPNSSEKRQDDDLDTGVNAKMMFTKNFGWGAGYVYSNHRSNYADTSENYKEEVVTTTAIFAF